MKKRNQLTYTNDYNEDINKCNGMQMSEEQMQVEEMSKKRVNTDHARSRCRSAKRLTQLTRLTEKSRLFWLPSEIGRAHV